MIPSAPFPTPQSGPGDVDTPNVGTLDSNIQPIQGALLILLVLVVLAGAAAVLTWIAMWHTFRKADQPRGAALIPIYNLVVLPRIANRSPWWTLLVLVPIGGAVAFSANPAMMFTNPGLYWLVATSTILSWLALSFPTGIGVAVAFGRSPEFGAFALGLFWFVGYPILGFGSADHQPSWIQPHPSPRDSTVAAR